ncbi:MAG: outer membrane lipoprotein-sorting protein [Gammaproteobacteria bacterium]|nr:outer membrane lipoprotein-sorting protein [Gammaproteobacteria bacterium]
MFEALLFSVALAAEPPEAAALLRQADRPRQSLLHSTLRVRITTEQPESAPQTSELEVLLGDEHQQLVLFRDKQNRGRKFLTVGDKSWLIVPGARNPIAMTANQRMMGASSFSDIARVRLASDYTGQLRDGTEACGDSGQECRIVEIAAGVKSAPYASGTLWIDGNGLLRKALYRLASGKPAKEVVYRYKDSDGETTPSGLTLTDLLSGDRAGRTVLEYLDRQPGEHPASTFDPQQQVRR